jgi:hypothetical protein
VAAWFGVAYPRGFAGPAVAEGYGGQAGVAEHESHEGATKSTGDGIGQTGRGTTASGALALQAEGGERPALHRSAATPVVGPRFNIAPTRAVVVVGNGGKGEETRRNVPRSASAATAKGGSRAVVRKPDPPSGSEGEGRRRFGVTMGV